MWPWHVKMATQNMLKLLLLLMLTMRIVLATVCCRSESWGLVMKQFFLDIEHKVWSRFNFVTSTKPQQNTDQTSASKSRRTSTSTPKPGLSNLQQTVANTILITNISNSNNLNKFWVTSTKHQQQNTDQTSASSSWYHWQPSSPINRSESVS